MKEGFIELDGQDKPQKMYYDTPQKANNKTLADKPKTVKLNDSSIVMNDKVMRLCLKAPCSFREVPCHLRMGEDSLNMFSIWLETLTARIKSDLIH